MTKQLNETIFKLFLPDNPRFAPLTEMFLEGIPVFFVSKKEIKGVPSGEYSWKVELDLLSQEQKFYLINWFASVTCTSKEIIEAEGVYIPEQIVQKVLASDVEEIEAKFAYLSQIASKHAIKSDDIVLVSLPMISLHFICLACIRLFISGEFEGYGNDILMYHIPDFIKTLSGGDEEVREFYEFILNNSSVVEDSKDS